MNLFLETLATIFGILSVWYARNNKIYVFPTGIVSVLIFAYLTFINKIYAETGINIYYFVMSVYGWVLWGSKNKKIQKKISFSSTSEIIFSITISIIFYIIIYTILKNTDSDVIILDSLTTSLSLTAMLLLARRKIENWIFWIIADLIYIPLYLYKGLYITSLQYFFFLILATSGYIEWKKNIKKWKEFLLLVLNHLEKPP